MEYTSNKLAKMSGVSARTLRHYDDISLLKPMRTACSGYRIYGQQEVDALQQILFYRELGFSLKDIKEMLSSPDFSREQAFANHLAQLHKKRERLDALINNVSKSIASMKGVAEIPDKDKFDGFYHLLYEKRYQNVYKAGADYWGHTPNDEELTQALTDWVNQHNLKGKRIIDFFCGEGSAGVILSKLGCVYHGVDVAPSALEKAKNSLRDYSTATIEELNIVSGEIAGTYDAAIDIMGFHMLVTDPDRMAYLKNACTCLKNGAPMFFFRELHDEGAYSGYIGSFEEWLAVTKHDYTTARQLNYKINGKEVEVQIPYVPARSMSKAKYTRELTEAEFVVDSIVDMPPSNKCGESVSIFVHKLK